MLLNLLNFFDEAAEGGEGAQGSVWGQVLVWGVGILFIVGIALMMIIPQRKQKKRQEEMMSKLGLGSIVTTVGGIVGEVVELDDKHVWLLTGSGDNKCTMQFVRQAIGTIAPAPGSPEAEAEAKAAKETDEVDEIK